MKVKLGPRRETMTGWSREVWVNGVRYWVGVTRGRRVRIAFKPRGPRGWGYQWHGYVNNGDGKRLWDGRVGGSLGARGLLEDAGVLAVAAIVEGLEALG